MRKNYFKFFATLLVFATLAGCKETPVDTEILVEKVTLNKTTLSVVVGESASLVATVTPDDADNTAVNWSSSDTSIATVDEDGKIATLEVGEVVITAASDENPSIKATCTLTVVTDEVPMEGVTLEPTTLDLFVGEIFTLSYTTAPEDCTNLGVVWTSSDEAIATVDAEGIVTAVANGEATITVASDENAEVKAECVVTVKTQVSEIILDPVTAQFEVGDELQIVATVLPAGATDTTMTWTSSDENILSVSEEGLVTAISGGDATITVTSNSNEEVSATFTANVYPEATEPTVELYNITPGSYAFTADMRIAGGAEAGVYYATYANYVTDPTTQCEYYLTSPYYQKVVAGSQEIIWQEFNKLNPGQEYIIMYAPANLNDDGSFESLAGEIQYQNVTTLQNEFGHTEATAAITVNEEAATFSSLSLTFANDGDCMGVIFGCVKSSDIAEEASVEDYVKNTWMGEQTYLNITTFYTYGATDYWETLDLTKADLVDDTEYTVFNIAVSKGGQLGVVSSTTARTAALQYYPEYNPSAEITCDLRSAQVDMTMPEGVERVYYVKELASEKSDDDIKVAILKNIANEAIYYSWDASGVYDLLYLTYNSDYKLGMIAVTPDGEFSELVIVNFSTIEADFTSDATLDETHTYGTHPWSSSEGACSVSVDVKFENGTVGFYFAEVSSYYQKDFDGDGVFSALDAGGSMISAGMVSASYYKAVEGTYTSSTTSAESIFVMMPVDADGIFGTPIMFSKTLDGVE